MNATPYHRKLDRVLDRMGGVYHTSDILDRIADGRMQSFVEGNSWLITQVCEYPRAKTLDFVAAVGDLKDWPVLHDLALSYADHLNIPLIRAYGRRGWFPMIEDRGWKILTVNQVYVKEP
jgi:hypothetical protein